MDGGPNDVESRRKQNPSDARKFPDRAKKSW